MMGRGITLTCCILLLLHESVLGFVLQPHRTSRLIHVNAKRSRTEDGSKRKKRSPKPRRFTQEAHSAPNRPPQQRSSWSKDQDKSMFSDSSLKQEIPSSQDTDFMWRSGKSIEELESIMTKRWGTDVQRWTADPSEYEFVDDNEGDSKKSKNKVFRGKPVLDPWQKEEQRQNPNQQESGGFFSSEDDAMLKRVRKNQERLQKKVTSDTPPLENEQDWDDGNEDEGDVILEDDFPEEMVMEFYDEDDEGFEPSSRNGYGDDEFDGLYNMENLINPKPVGGRGSKSIPERATKQQSSPGFFFNDAAAAQPMSEPMEVTPQESHTTARSKRNMPRSRAVLDEDGNPMYLTVEQAQRNFESFLETGEDDDDGYTPPVTRSWEELGITSPQLLRNLRSMGCSTPLSVQDKACPPVLTGNDVLVGTYTGSGKTLAFLVPLAQRLLFTGASPGKDVQVLIVAPGRELASQIVSVARSLLEGTDLSVMMAIGGTTFGRNLEQIRKKKPSILVGTPGRIAELVIGRPGEKSGRLKVGSLQSLVLDEFDALLEYKPHRDPTKAIVQSLKRRHGDTLQSILCSATASDMIKSPKLQYFLRLGYAQAMADQNDKLITSGEETPAKDSSTVTRVSRTVMHGAIHVPHRRVALETLRRILHTEPLPQQVLVFADTSHRVEILVDKLADMGIIAAPLHGGRGSEKVDRAEVSKALREGYVGIVVATEMAARGLDAPLLTHVINLDLPTDASHYAHRAGRCGRGGRPGVVINFTTKPKERNVPKRFAETLGITMHDVEARGGKLCVIDTSDTDTADS